MLDVKKILFNVDNESREVSLHYGPMAVVVCRNPEDFSDWVQQFVEQMNVIADEMKEYYEG